MPGASASTTEVDLSDLHVRVREFRVLVTADTTHTAACTMVSITMPANSVHVRHGDHLHKSDGYLLAGLETTKDAS